MVKKSEIKIEIFVAYMYIFKGINRGIFGVPSSKKSDIETLVKLLESQNPTPDPTLNLEKVKFQLYSICGNKLKDLVTVLFL